MNERTEYHTLPGVRGTFDVDKLWGQFGIGDVKGLSVLDVGSNVCGWSIVAALRGAVQVVAIDWSRPLHIVQDCISAGVNVEFVPGDVCDPTLLNESFDLVLCLSTLHGVNHPASLIRNLGRWTRWRAVVELEVAFGHRASLDVVPEEYLDRPDAYTDPDSPPLQKFLSQGAVAAALELVGLHVDRIVPGRKPCRIAFDCSKK